MDKDADAFGDIGLAPSSTPDHLVGPHQPAHRRPSDLDSLAPTDVFDAPEEPLPEKPLVAALKAKESLSHDLGELYRIEFEDLLERDENGEDIDEDRLYFLQLYARRQVGEELSRSETLDLAEFEKEETLNAEDEGDHDRPKDGDKNSDSSAVRNQYEPSGDVLPQTSMIQSPSGVGSLTSGREHSPWKTNGELPVDKDSDIPALVDSEDKIEPQNQDLTKGEGENKAEAVMDLHQGGSQESDNHSQTMEREKETHTQTSSLKQKTGQGPERSDDRLLWWRANGKLLVSEKLASHTNVASFQTNSSSQTSNTKALATDANQNPMVNSSVASHSGIPTSFQVNTSDDPEGLSHKPQLEVRRTSGVGSGTAAMSRREALSEKRRKIMESRRAQKRESLKDNSYANREDKPDSALVEASESKDSKSSTTGSARRRMERLAESKRLAERTALARKARLEREAALLQRTKDTQSKGRGLSEKTEGEELDPPTEDLLLPLQTVDFTIKQPAEAQSSAPQESQHSLVPHMVKEVERLSSFITRYERKLESTCNSLLPIAPVGDNGTNNLSANPSLPELYAFVTEQIWFKEHASDGFVPSTTISAPKLEGSPSQRSRTTQKSGDKESGVYRISSLGESFLKVDGPVVADVGRFLTSLIRFKDGLPKAAIQQNWSDIARLSGDMQSERIHENLDDIISFCLASRFIE
eukprot:scaffold1784_cov116-Cylindrotheca_fusiformis.AAC.1